MDSAGHLEHSSVEIFLSGRNSREVALHIATYSADLGNNNHLSFIEDCLLIVIMFLDALASLDLML